jgi:hypothetical protein
MRAANVADTRLHCVLPLYDMVYADKVREARYFDKEGNLTHTLLSRPGAKQGFVLGIFIFCVTMAPFYTVLKIDLGPEVCLSLTRTTCTCIDYFIV